MGRHGKSKGIDNCVDDNRTILVGESFSQSFSNVAGFFDPNSFRPHCFSNFSEIWILEFDAMRNEASLLLFDMDEVKFLVVENNLNHGRAPLYLGEQIAHAQHGKASIAT